MFKSKVTARYQVLCAEDMLVKMIEDAEKELLVVEKELKKAQDEYEKFVEDEATPLDKLQALEKKIEELEDERDEAAKNYEKAKETTMDDLKAEQRHQDWKDNR
jgi:chromosome segregation ATPase